MFTVSESNAYLSVDEHRYCITRWVIKQSLLFKGFSLIDQQSHYDSPSAKLCCMKESTLRIPTLTTTRLRLEPLSMSHSQGMFQTWRHDAVQEFSGPAKDEYGNTIQLPARTHHDSDRLIQFWIKAAKDGWGFRWAILIEESDEFVGHIGFNSLTECCEIAYHMNPVFWGKGLMTEAAQAALERRSSEGATEIEAFIDPQNSGSIALALRLGMEATDTFSEGAQRYRACCDMLAASPEK